MRLAERIPDPNVWRVYRATLALGLAYGIAISLTAIFLDQIGFEKSDIGTLAAWFATGIVALSLPMGALIRRFSAKTTLAMALGGYAITVSVFPFLHSYTSIAVVRFFDGACSVGVWVSSETILLERSGKDNKAFVTSLYAIAIAVGYVVGPLAARAIAAVAPLRAGFLAAGVLAAITSVYVTTRLERGPSASDPDEADAEAGSGRIAPAGSALGVLWRIKTLCFGTFAYGYFQASVVLFLPLYLMESKGIAEKQTIIIPAFFAAGMLLFSNYAGRLGDRYGHLLLMRVLGTIGTAMVLGFVFLHSFAMMGLAVFVAGATLASISPVSLALQGVVSAPEEYSRATSIYNAFYAAGMLLGPPISSMIFEHVGGAAMLYHLAALWGGFVAFSLLFYRDDPAARRAPELAAPPV